VHACTAALQHPSFVAVALFLFALLPRVVATGRFVTVDEGYHWFARAGQFLRAVRAHEWGATTIIGHPGVTTLWLGAGGQALYEALVRAGALAASDATLREMLRLPVGVVTALCVALGYLMLRRLLPGRVALLGALLWAADPFLIAHSQLLHLDALLASLMFLSLLAALLAFRIDDGVGGVRWGWLVASALAGGLALLTKSPSVLLVGMVAVVAVWAYGVRPTGPRAMRPYVMVTLGMLVWSAAAAGVWVALWPAAWVDPAGAVGVVVHQAAADGGSPHGWGNFFLGRAVADPGPLFYPVAVALRLTPWASAGLLAAVWFGGAMVARRGWRGVQATRADGRVRIGPRLPGGHPGLLLLLVLYAILFVAMMTIPPKKFDRYALPVFPALDVLAAAGLVALWERVRRAVARWLPPGRNDASDGRHVPAAGTAPVSAQSGALANRRFGSLAVKLAGWALVIAPLAATLAWYHPYELAYYNPLLGGGPTARMLLPIGWGEGYDQVGAYIQAQTDGRDYPVASWFGPSLQPFVSAPVVPLSWALTPGKAGYAVLYVDQVQRGDEAAATEMLRQEYAPIHTIRIHGIDYAWIYQLSRPVARLLPADFGDAIHFRGYDLDTSRLRSSGGITLTVHWQARAPVARNLTLFIHVLDGAGNRIGQADVPPAGPRDPTATWRPGAFVTGVHRVPVWGNALRGPIWLAVGLYDPQTGARMTLRGPAAPPGAPAAGPDALLIGPMRVP
jgi:hypothetical protein